MNPYPREGQNWAHFEIRSEIARGNMGVVYRAVDTRTKREVALKILVGGHDNPDAVERFKREAKSLARCNHPNIVNVHTYGVTQGLPFLTMDYVPGTTLQELLDRGALTLPRAVDLLGRMARGLDHVHSRGVLHRDVKPANVLIGADGAPRITDFGLAKLSDASISLTQDGDIIGTPIFMSPEQIQGQQKLVGPSTDVWALGVILYQMLAGELPFRGRTVDQVSQAVVQMEPTPPRELQDGVPEDLERICLAALAKDPRQRYGSGGELARDLEAYLRGDRVLAGQVTPGVRARRAARFVKLHAGPVGALALSVLLLCGVLGLHLFFEARARAALEAEQREKSERLADLVEGALARSEEALGERRPDLALAAAQEALRKVEQDELERPELRAALDAAASRARIALGSPREEAATAAKAFVSAFLADQQLADGEACVDYYWHCAQPELGPLAEAPLKRLSTLTDPNWLRLIVRLGVLAREERPWRALLERPGPLRAQARQLEVTWLLDRERTSEAFVLLEQLPFEDAPLLHARYLRAVQDLERSVRGSKLAAPLSGVESWLEAHARLTSLAAAGRLEDRVRAAAAEAEVALILGESARAEAIVAAARSRPLPSELEAELELPLLIAKALRGPGSARSEGLAQDVVARLPRIEPGLRTRLAGLARAMRLSEVAYPLDLARDAERVDRLREHIFVVIGAIALHRLGSGPHVLSDTTQTQSGPLADSFVAESAERTVHPLFNSAAGLHATLADLDMGQDERNRLRARLFGQVPWLRHPTYSLARRMIHAGLPLEPSDLLARPAPLGLQEGRLLLARIRGREWREPALQASRALGLAVRLRPADLDTRLARAELFLRMAACAEAGGERMRHWGHALSEAAAAVACSSGSPAARSLFLQTLWVADEVEFARLNRPDRGRPSRFDDWLEPRSALPAADVLLVRALRSNAPGEALAAVGVDATPLERASLALASRRLTFLQRARGGSPEGAAEELADQLEEQRLAAPEADQLWILGERLLTEPTLALRRLLEGRSALSPADQERAQREAGRAEPAGQPGQRAAAARALLLLDHLGRQEGPSHAGWLRGWELLQDLWRERPGRACNALQVLLTLWTRAPEPALARDLVHAAKRVPDPFLEQVAELERGAQPKFAAAPRIAAWVKLFARQERE